MIQADEELYIDDDRNDLDTLYNDAFETMNKTHVITYLLDSI